MWEKINFLICGISMLTKPLIIVCNWEFTVRYVKGLGDVWNITLKLLKSMVILLIYSIPWTLLNFFSFLKITDGKNLKLSRICLNEEDRKRITKKICKEWKLDSSGKFDFHENRRFKSRRLFSNIFATRWNYFIWIFAHHLQPWKVQTRQFHCHALSVTCCMSDEETSCSNCLCESDSLICTKLLGSSKQLQSDFIHCYFYSRSLGLKKLPQRHGVAPFITDARDREMSIGERKIHTYIHLLQ